MFNSLNRRYVFTSVVWVIYLLISALVVNNNANHLRSENLKIRQERNTLVQINQSFTFEIAALENLMLTFLLEPELQERQSILQSLQRLEQRLQEFKSLPVLKNYQLAKNISEISKGLGELKTAILELMEVREDVERLFPASRILFQDMLPENRSFHSAVTIAIDESGEKTQRQRKIRNLFIKARHHWVLTIGYFRVFVANRLGVFSIRTHDALRAQKENIHLYLNLVKQDLQELSKFKKQLNFEQQSALQSMYHAYGNWTEAFEKAAKIYESENWRSDTPILKNRIGPAKSLIWKALKSNDGYLESLAAKENEALSTATSKIVSTAIFLVVVGILLTVFGYLAFDYLVRRPVREISSRLLSEAEGKHVDLLDETNLQEMNDLIHAFNQITLTSNLSQKKMGLMMGHVSDGVFVVDNGGVIESVNPGFESLFGYKTNEVLGRNISVVVSENFRQAHRTYVEKMQHAVHILGKTRQLMAQDKSGNEFFVNLKLFEFKGNGQIYYMGLVNRAGVKDRNLNVDYDETDVLTGLYNDKYIRNMLKIKVGAEQVTGLQGGLLYCDIDDMLIIELEYGQKQVEDVLMQLADFLRKRIRREDTVARAGYDEFVVLLDAEKETCIKIAEDIRKRIEQKKWVKNMSMTVSIGVLMIADASSEDVDDILICAKEACKLAKKAGSNRINVFNRATLGKLNEQN